MEKRRAGIVALLAMLMGAAALTVGAGGAGAGVCDGEPFPNDIQVDVHGVATVGADPFIENKAVWVCLNPPGQESGIGIADPNPSSPGFVVGVWGCGWYAGGGCGDTVGLTGAEVAPQTSTNLPSDGDSTTQAEAKPGHETCVYVDGTEDCSIGGLTIGTVTIAEGDLPTAEVTYSSPPPSCTGINNTCPGVRVREQDDPDNPTLDVNLGFAGFTREHSGANCVQVNSVCPE